MTHHIRMLSWGGAMVMVGLVAVAAAQQTPSTRDWSKPADTYDSSRTQTIAGCLRSAEGGGFVLAEASQVKPAGQPVGTAGTASVEKRNYTLKGVVPPGIDLAKHMNHRVEVAGTITEATATEKQPSVNMHTFTHVAATCP
jgi:hypothetical protein